MFFQLITSIYIYGIKYWIDLFLIAAQNGHGAIAQKLLHHGANIDCRIKSGATPLITACQNNHLPVVKLLIENRAQINSATNTGDTPLHYAVLANSLEMVKLLLAHHSKLVPNKAGQTALDTAKEKHYRDPVIILEDYVPRSQIEKVLNESTTSTEADGGATGGVRPKDHSKLITKSQITNVARMAAVAKFKAKLEDEDSDLNRELAELGLRNDLKGNSSFTSF